jgi:hypothetical protein
VIEVDEHDHAGFRCDASKGDETDRNGERQIKTKPPQ